MTDMTREELRNELNEILQPFIEALILYGQADDDSVYPPSTAELLDAILARLPPVEQIRAEARREALEEAMNICRTNAKWYDDNKIYVAADAISGAEHEIRALTSHTPKEEKA
jgi:hypothetical protein